MWEEISARWYIIIIKTKNKKTKKLKNWKVNDDLSWKKQTQGKTKDKKKFDQKLWICTHF